MSACLVPPASPPYLLTRRPLRPPPPLLLLLLAARPIAVHHNHLVVVVVVVVDVVITPLGGRGGGRREEVADLALLPDRRVVELLCMFGFDWCVRVVTSRRCVMGNVLRGCDRTFFVHAHLFPYPDGEDRVGVAAHEALDGEGAGGAHREACVVRLWCASIVVFVFV